MDIIKIDLTKEQRNALAPLRELVQEAHDRAADASPDGVTPFLPPLGMIIAQVFVGEARAQMHCVYVPPDVAAQMVIYIQKAMDIA